jgi:hypothetical protein
MTPPTTDRELLEAAWQTYDDEFAEHVGHVVTPDDYLDTDEQVDWAARVFMFAYALGSIAGANATDPDPIDAETDRERVETIVDHVVDIHESDAFAASNARVKADFLE